MGKIVGIIGCGLCMCVSQADAWATWYVDGSVKKPGSGTSWQGALRRIQEGIDEAADGDTVIVAQGTYVENIRFEGKNIILRSTNPTDWNVVKETIIDGNQAGSVVTFAGMEDDTCVLSGFAIRNGTGSWGPDGLLYGGGIVGSLPMPRPRIQNNVITGNSAHNGGGIALCAGVIENCIICGNSATGTSEPDWGGGGIILCNGIIQNNLIAGNSAGCGGGISFSNADFRNNVVVGNAAPGIHGGGVAHLGTSPYTPPGGSLANCIVWANTSPTGPQVHDSVAPSRCCIQDWTGGGEGNIALDPQFLDADGADNDPHTFEDNDYRLSAASCCIDAGTNEDWMLEAVDLDGNPRILVGASSVTVDIGAYEYKFAIAGVSGGPSGKVELRWDVRPTRSYTVWSRFDLAVATWTEEETITADKGEYSVTWSDAVATSSPKFYRIELK